MPKFSPRLDVLPEAQRRLWGELSAVPEEFTLYGGTALALHLGHRRSVDFDFFGSRTLDIASLEGGIPFLSGAAVVQREKNTLTAIVNRGGPVKVSFFGVPKLPRLATPVKANDNGLKIASLLDLAGTKASVLQLRAEAKDYIDMDALMKVGQVSLPFALAAAGKLYGPSFNPEITLKALSYFEDGNLQELPTDMKFRLANAVRSVDLDDLPRLEDFKLPNERDTGLGL
ncbi:MAG TPA: nucleotidyl transferase AbiEii/AbiGii toxin family protein [Steroidobacteraceae bacterium]|nr:nucleotidyl transferase AbiEii/AbiGii toxin family protein [Steroidobacteraceae bacterium]